MTQQALAKIDFSALQQFVNPEELQAINDKFAGGITGGSWLPELKYRGNRWRLKIEGEEKVLPSTEINVHLIDARPNLSKTFYEGGYTQGSDSAPDCSSIDGFNPDSHIENPQSDNCQTCPNNAWGSKISESGGKGKACSDFKQIVVAFAGHLDKAFALRVPAASLKGYKAYVSQLSFNKVPAYMAITQISLDPETTYPSLLFSCVGIVQTREEFNALKELADTDDVKQVVQIQPRAERALPAGVPSMANGGIVGGKTAEQPVVVSEAVLPAQVTNSVPDLRSILDGTDKKPAKTRKKKAADVIEESTAETADVQPGVVNTLDELLSKL